MSRVKRIISQISILTLGIEFWTAVIASFFKAWELATCAGIIMAINAVFLMWSMLTYDGK